MEIEEGHIILVAFLCGIALLVWLVFNLANRQQRKTQEVWRNFALRSGLHYELQANDRKHARVWGLRHGRNFAMEEVSVRVDTDTTTIRTRMHLKVRGMPVGLVIHELPAGPVAEKVLGGLLNIAKAMGASLPQVIKTGDAAFDEKWVIRGVDEETTRSWIATGRRKQILAAFIAEEGFDTSEEGLAWEGSTPKTADTIDEIVGILEDYSERLEKAP